MVKLTNGYNWIKFEIKLTIDQKQSLCEMGPRKDTEKLKLVLKPK